MTNPRSVDDALGWQLQRIGSTAWEGWSWKFQRLAFGFSRDDRWQDAGEALAWFSDHGGLQPGEPQRGCLVWTVVDRNTVVRCSLDGTRVIGPGLPDAVRIGALADLTGYLGWTEPAFPFAR